MINLQETLAKAVKDMMMADPYYGLFLMGVRRYFEDLSTPVRKGTAQVSMRNLVVEMHIDPVFWEELTPNHRIGLLKHELLHVMFFHLTDYQRIDEEDPEISNIAKDIEINQHIEVEYLPPNPCLPESFPELNLEPKKGTLYYYEKLRQAKESSQAAVQAVMQAIQDAIDNSQGQCTLPNGKTITIPNHSWEAVSEMSEAKVKLMKMQIQHVMEEIETEVEKSRGTVPSEIKLILEKLRELDPPKFDWKGYLRRFVGKSTKIYTKKTRRKMSKRMPEFPGLKIKQHKHVMVAIDTSGSVSNTELVEFLQEIYHISKTGCDITLVECDAAISYIGKFNPKKNVEIHGRGGTDFQPVIDYYKENRHQYSCMFYLTDGEAPSPDGCPKDVLWVLSNRSHMNKNLPGKVIQLEI